MVNQTFLLFEDRLFKCMVMESRMVYLIVLAKNLYWMIKMIEANLATKLTVGIFLIDTQMLALMKVTASPGGRVAYHFVDGCNIVSGHFTCRLSYFPKIENIPIHKMHNRSI